MKLDSLTPRCATARPASGPRTCAPEDAAVAERIDDAGFQAIELIASSHIKKCVRELKEDPFERMRLVAKKITKTPLRAIGAERISAFELTPDSVVDLWFERLVANGIKQLRISDPANDPAGWRKSVSEPNATASARC